MNEIEFFQAVELSLSAIVIVVLILTLLYLIVGLFEYLPTKKDLSIKPVITNENNDEEERIVAILVASIIGQKHHNKDVLIKSIKRVGK